MNEAIQMISGAKEGRKHGSHLLAWKGVLGNWLTIVDRGADGLAGAGSISAEQALALKAEARRRAEAGEFFGHISFISLIARKSC